MRRSLAVTLALLCTLGSLAACGGEDDGGAVGAGGDGDSGVVEPGDPGSDPNAPVTDPAPGDTTAPPVTTPGGARIVNPTPGLLDANPTALDSVVQQPNDKLEVRFYGGVEGCHGVDRIQVEESDTEVTVTVFTGTPPEAAARTCIEIAELQAVIVALAGSLNGRAVIDGSSGAEVPLS